MRAAGELREDVSLDSIRSAMNSIFEGMLRDQVLASRMGYPARFDRAELMQIFRIVLGAFLVPARR